ncbi:MAG TPA: conjugal transfer protein TrbH [Anaerolineae bacterium]|nr:conjugal transfer protein TrbH [Anaerolineae bacterium]
MRKLAIAALFLFALAGCATTGHYGNFAQSSNIDHQKLASDAAKQLAMLYPPAQTRLELKHATPDAFGVALVKTLREKGYSLMEFTPASRVSSAPPADSASSALPLRYVLDKAGDDNLYRLSLMAGEQSITRPYLAQNGSFVPAGYWARKE